MAKSQIVWNQLYFKGWSLSQDLTARILAIDGNGKIVDRPPFDTSSFVSSSLSAGNIFVGNGSNVATGVPMTGDINIASNGFAFIVNGVIVDGDINASAAISVSKLAIQTPSRVATFDGSGFLAPSSVTTTTLAFLDATSSIQTQLNTRLTATITSVVAGDMLRYSGSAWVNFPVGTNGFVLTVVAGVPVWAAAAAGNLPVGGTAGQYLNKIDGTNYNAQWSTLTVAKITDLTASAAELNIMDGVTTDFTHINYLTDVTSLIQAQLNAKQATITGGASTIATSNLATNLVLVSDGSGKVIVSTVSTTILGYIGGLTSSAQAQINSKLSNSLSQNAIWVGNGSNVAIELAPGTTGYVLTSVGGVPTWQPPAGGGGGTVSGPGSSTDNGVVRWDGVLGTVVQNSVMIVDDTGNITGATWTSNKIGLAYGGTNADLSGTGGAGKYLKQASAGAAITVASITAAEITSGAALTKVDDTNVILTLGGSPTTALLVAASLTLGWTGTLAYARFVNGAGLSVVGRSTNSAGVQADIAAGTDADVLRRSGTAIGFGTIGDASISALAFSKLTGVPTTLAGYGILDAANKYWTLNPQSGTTYTFVLTDKDTVLVQATNAAASTFTIPPNASVAYPTGSQIALVWDGVGQPSFAAGAGVTLSSSSGDLTVPARYAIAIATKIATNTWYVWNGAAFATQTANTVFAGPTSGGAAVPTFRALVAADIAGLTSASFSALTAAVATNTIDNANYVQDWKWGTLLTGSALKVEINSTGTISGSQVVFEVVNAGANSNSAQTTYGAYFQNARTGTTSTNIGLNVRASGGTTNIALMVDAGQTVFGSTAITAGSVLVDFVSATQGIVLTRVTNLAAVTTPVDGMVVYDIANNLTSFRQNGNWTSLGQQYLGKTNDLGAFRTAELLSGVTNNKASTYFDSTTPVSWNGLNSTTNILNTVPNLSTVLVTVTMTGIQTSGTAGSTGFAVKICRMFRRTATTTVAVGTTTTLVSFNDTGLTFSALALITSGSSINLDRTLSATTITFNTLVKVEVDTVV